MADLTNPTTIPPQPNVTPSPGETLASATSKQSLSVASIIITLVIGTILGAGSVSGYILANQGTLQLTSKDTTSQSSTSPTPTPQSTPTPTPDPTANWKTYTHQDDKYSFKYPADWQLTEEFDSDPYTESNTRLYEHITLSASGQEIVGLQYPFELSGCGQTVYKAYIFGDEPVTMTSDCESNIYLGFFVSPYQPGFQYAKGEPSLVITYHYSAEHDEEFKLLAKSFTGLKLPKD